MTAMRRVGLVATMLVLAAMLALPACSNKKGSFIEPAGSSDNNGGNNMGNSGGSGY
jgi:hypothetical protein